MKLFAAALVIAIVASAQALTEEQKDKLRAYKKECFESSGVAKEQLEDFKKGIYHDDDQKLKDFKFCVAKKIGLLNEAGEYQLDVIKAKAEAEFGAEAAAKLVAECTEKTYANGPETSFHLAKCYHEKSPHLVSVA